MTANESDSKGVQRSPQTLEEAIDQILFEHKEVFEKAFSADNLKFDRFTIKNKPRPIQYFIGKKTPSKKTETKPAAPKVVKHIRFGKPKPHTPAPVSRASPQKKEIEAPGKPSGEPTKKTPIPIPLKEEPKQTLAPPAPIKNKPAPETKEPPIQSPPSKPIAPPPTTAKTADDLGRINQQEAEWLDTLIKKASQVTPPPSKPIESINEEKPKKHVKEEKTDDAREQAAREILQKSVAQKPITPDETPAEKQIPMTIKPVKETKQTPSPATTKTITVTSGGKGSYAQEVLQRKSTILQQLGLSEKQWEELDFYSLHEPFAYVEIIRDTHSLDKRYIFVEVDLTNEESQALKFIQDTLKVIAINTEEIDLKGVAAYLEERVKQIVKDYKINLSPVSMQKVTYFLEKDYVGLGLIDSLMRDPNIEDISCDGANVSIFLYHREYGSVKSNIEFKDEEYLSAFVVRLAQKCGKHISIAEPMLDATMPDGSRIQMTLSAEVTAKGSTFTIRKFREDPFSPPDLIEFNTMSAEMVAYMWMVVENGVNALIAGGTAAGKTSTLNALSLFIPRDAKIVSIEETREINLPHPNWIPGVARSGFGEVVADKVVGEIDMYDLMKAALRQRPDYILVGEIRGKEAYVLFQAMATGHTTYSTAHADSAQSLIHRLEGKPIEIPRIMLQALDIVCIQVTTRVKNKRARRCKQIIEIIDIDPTTKEILTNEVFRWDPIEDTFTYSGKSYVLENIRVDKDIARDAMTQELKNRAELLQWMNRTNVRDFRQVAMLLAQYGEDPTSVMKKVRS